MPSATHPHWPACPTLPTPRSRSPPPGEAPCRSLAPATALWSSDRRATQPGRRPPPHAARSSDGSTVPATTNATPALPERTGDAACGRQETVLCPPAPDGQSTAASPLWGCLLIGGSSPRSDHCSWERTGG